MLSLQLGREEEFWKQKAGIDWFKDGERNTNVFHTVVKGRRSRLKIDRIQNEGGEWVEELNQIAKAAEQFNQKQFAKGDHNNNFQLLEHIPTIVNASQNVDIDKVPNMQKVKEAVIGLNRSSTAGPDGMTGAFF